MYTEKDLEVLIDKKIEDELLCKQFPFLCAKAASTQGRQQVIDFVKHLIFDEGITNIDACFAQMEQILSEPDTD